VRGALIQATGAAAAGSYRVEIVAFSTYQEYRPYQWTPFAVGYSVPQQPRGLIVMQSLTGELRLLVHEYVHLLLRAAGKQYPAWLEEGLAEFYSTVRVEAGSATLGEFAPGNDQRLRSARWTPIDKLTATAYRLPLYDRSAALMFYSQCWALVHMLHFDPEWRSGLPAMLSLVGAGVPAAEAFPKAFHRSLRQAGRDLENYVRQGRHRLRRARPAPESEPAAIQVADADPADVNRVLADARRFAAQPVR
jgi:hypothetical protein